jgi:hypothetical protein
MGLSRSALRALTEPRGSLAPRPTTGSREGRWKASGTDKRSRARDGRTAEARAGSQYPGTARGSAIKMWGARLSESLRRARLLRALTHRQRCCFHEGRAIWPNRFRPLRTSALNLQPAVAAARGSVLRRRRTGRRSHWWPDPRSLDVVQRGRALRVGAVCAWAGSASEGACALETLSREPRAVQRSLWLGRACLLLVRAMPTTVPAGL